MSISENIKLVPKKGLAFPFQRGDNGFPKLADGNNVYITNIIALIDTGLNERVMHSEMGVDVNQYIFEDMTPIQWARLSNTISVAIEQFIDGVKVEAVNVSEVVDDNGEGTVVNVDVFYTVGNESFQQSVDISPRS